MNNLFDGFDDLESILKTAIKKAETENVLNVLESGADVFIKDLNKLTRPYSEIHKNGYTHLVDSFSKRRVKNQQIEVLWNKYYGPIVENGTRLSKAKPHMIPTFKKNKELYYQTMIKN